MLIDERLCAAGWHVCDRSQIDLVNHVGVAVRGAMLAGCDLTGADFARADLRGTDFRGTKSDPPLPDNVKPRDATITTSVQAATSDTSTVWPTGFKP